MKPIVIMEGAFVAACNPEFPFIDLVDGKGDLSFHGLRIVRGKSCVLVHSDADAAGSRLLVIGSGKPEFFQGVPQDEKATVLDRCVRIALRSWDKKIALNPSWMPYRKDNRTSLFAYGSSDLRIIAESNYLGSDNTYVYDIAEASKSTALESLIPDEVPYRAALSEVTALHRPPDRMPSSQEGAIELEPIASRSVAKGFAYEEWLPLLSAQQRDFVERDVSGPIRVRGAAGTGKTLAMVMKALKLAKDSGANPSRILFLTHSWAMAGQVDEMVQRIGRDIPSASSIEVFPLLEISSQRDYRAIGRRPLGLDSEAGKRETLKIIDDLVDNFIAGDWVVYRGGCSPEFAAAFEAQAESRERKNTTWEILIEFACVLAAQGLLGRGADRERYMRIRRVGYMMPLNTVGDKEVIFRLWGDFLSYLREKSLISSDQIISDYLNELQTFYWEAKRTIDGYDYIFVDEMHLFNAQERLVFHNLLADGDGIPKVIMALDPKQSPREIFADIADDRDDKNTSIYERARLPNPDKVDFVDVYRYSIEIAALTKSVLDAVPALDMDDDWNLPGANSVAGHGPRPRYYLEKNATQSFKRSMRVAQLLQAESRKNGGQVAVLCMDYERFNLYRRAAEGQYPQKVFIIKSRDDVEKLRYMGRRIVLSTPEYVAGLQFDAVVLVDVNGNLVPDGTYKGHQERRFLSELYLGMSRAQRDLVLVASEDSDGLTPYLRKKVADGLLVLATD